MSEQDDRAILDLWPGATPPDGFADRVVRAAEAPARSRPRWPLVAAVVGVVAVAAALLVGSGNENRDAGAVVAAERRTVEIAGRAVAVLEPGATLTWRSSPDGVEVDQQDGRVFYRVGPGAAPFVVRTPAGRVRVHGTCFHVEVRMLRDKLVPAGAGAALAVIATVVVYEGVVTAENDAGSARVAAGQQAELGPNRAPLPSAVTPDPELVAMPERAPEGASREELLAREDAHLREIAALRQRVGELQKKVAGMPEPAEPGQPPRGKFHDFSAEELAWMAKECQVRYDIPGYAMELGIELGEHDAAELGLDQAERAGINRIFADGDSELLEQMRDLYVELTGNRDVAEALSPRNLQHEIFEKSRPEDLHRAFQRLSAERAGLAEPPADWSGLPPVERLLRLLARVGDDYQKRLAAIVGPARAEELRREAAGMGRRIQSGCPDE